MAPVLQTPDEARAPCNVFDLWVRWERGQLGIREFVRRPASKNMEIYTSGNLEIWNPKSSKNVTLVKLKVRSAQNARSGLLQGGAAGVTPNR